MKSSLQLFAIRLVGIFAGLIGITSPAMLISDAEAASCQAGQIRLVFGSIAETKMSVGSDVLCPIWVRLGTNSVEDIEIFSPPKHGTARLRGKTGVSYRSNPKFLGYDTFEFLMLGHSTVASGVAIIRVDVVVK